MAAKVWPQTYTPILGEEQVQYMLGRFYAPAALAMQMVTDEFIICHDDNGPVAFSSFAPLGDNGTWKLHKLYIVQDQQRRGTGSFMIEHITSYLTAKSAKQLILNVNRYNQKAINFYHKQGFTTLREEDIDIGNGYFMNDYVLGKEL